MTLALWLAAAAVAQPRSERALVQRALVAEAIRGDLPTAISRYTQLVRTLPDDHPLWIVSVVALARDLYDEGRVSEAREALRMAFRKGRCEAECQQLSQHIAIDEESVRELPVEWTFSNDNPGLFHFWAHQDRGELVPGARGLSWTTHPDPQQPDRLVVGFIRPEPAPERLEFTVRSVGSTSTLRVVLEDESGNRFTTAITPVPADLDAKVVATLSEAVSDDVPATLDPSALSRVALEDLTGRRVDAHTIEILAFRAE